MAQTAHHGKLWSRYLRLEHPIKEKFRRGGVKGIPPSPVTHWEMGMGEDVRGNESGMCLHCQIFFFFFFKFFSICASSTGHQYSFFIPFFLLDDSTHDVCPQGNENVDSSE